MATRHPPVLQAGETLTASTVVRATPEEVYAVVSDVTRIPQWSPECVRCAWVGEDRFKGWNRRAMGRWSTTSKVVVSEPGREFAFAVQMLGRDFTRWSYRTEPGDESGTTLLTEQLRMCRDLPRFAVLFERYFLRVRDRRTDLQGNLERSVLRIRELIEGGA